MGECKRPSRLVVNKRRHEKTIRLLLSGYIDHLIGNLGPICPNVNECFETLHMSSGSGGSPPRCSTKPDAGGSVWQRAA